MLHRLFKKTLYAEADVQTLPDDTPQRYEELLGKHDRLMDDYAKLQVQFRQMSDKQVSSESLIKVIKEKLQTTCDSLKDTAETLKTVEQEKVKLRSACDEQKMKVQDVKNELKEIISAKKKVELEVKQVAQKVKEEIMADFKSIIRGLETDKYELQKAQEKALAEIKELKAQNQKFKDELWEAITKWHNLEKDLEKQFKKKDISADEIMQIREENS